jgi:hypothetical protein
MEKTLIADVYFSLAILVLAVHLLFNAWVVFGAAVTRQRSALAAVHILSVTYGAVIENVSWPCPLTLAEKWFEARAGMDPYHGSFLVHYLGAFVYPHFPLELLRFGAISVCLVNLGIYARRNVRQRHPA